MSEALKARIAQAKANFAAAKEQAKVEGRPRTPFIAVPIGEYLAVPVEATFKENKKGLAMVYLNFAVAEGEFASKAIKIMNTLEDAPGEFNQDRINYLARDLWRLGGYELDEDDLFDSITDTLADLIETRPVVNITVAASNQTDPATGEPYKNAFINGIDEDATQEYDQLNTPAYEPSPAAPPAALTHPVAQTVVAPSTPPPAAFQTAEAPVGRRRRGQAAPEVATPVATPVVEEAEEVVEEAEEAEEEGEDELKVGDNVQFTFNADHYVSPVLELRESDQKVKVQVGEKKYWLDVAKMELVA